MERLNQYSMLGFPAMPELLTIGEKVYPEEIFEIESDWKQIVASPEVGYREISLYCAHICICIH